VALPLRHRGFWIEPAAALDYTGYSLGNNDPLADDAPSRSAPVLSADVGTVLERGAPGSSGWLQTLEPRAQYVYIPHRDQDDIPVFDTIEPDFNLVQLFRKNRYLGYDRLGDTSQLNVGLTSRLLDAGDGTQYLTATVGQSRFFSTQDVTLPGQSPVDSNSSDWLAELGMNFWDHWKMDVGWQWDTDAGQSRRSEASVRYRRDGQHAARFSYRYQRDNLEEVDVSVAWPLFDRWSAVGRYDYSILDDEALETYVGLEYQNCCWGLRLVYRRYLASRDGEYETSMGLQLLLKGLTNVDPPADRLLERGILGYESN
jgi:LPS-assembly protein